MISYQCLALILLALSIINIVGIVIGDPNFEDNFVVAIDIGVLSLSLFYLIFF